MEQSKMSRFDADTVILQQGSTKKELFKIISGKAAVYFNYGQPNEYLVGILSEQRCFGEITLLCGHPSIYTVVALSEVLLLRVTEEDFDEFIKNNYANAKAIMKNLAGNLITLSFNLNQLACEFAASDRNDPQQREEIARKIRQYTALDAGGGAFFTMKL